MISTRNVVELADTTAFQVAFEASALKLHIHFNESIDKVEDPLFVIVPVLHNFRTQHGYLPSFMLGELAAELKVSSRFYALEKTEHFDEGRGDSMVQTYRRDYKLATAISTDWLPQAALTYLVRTTGDIEVYSEIESPSHDYSELDASKALYVVAADRNADSKKTPAN